MTMFLSTPIQAALVAIDISKHDQEVVIQHPESVRHPRKSERDI